METAIKEAVCPLNNGEAVLSWPASITKDEVEDIKDWLKVVIKRIEKTPLAEEKPLKTSELLARYIVIFNSDELGSAEQAEKFLDENRYDTKFVQLADLAARLKHELNQHAAPNHVPPVTDGQGKQA